VRGSHRTVRELVIVDVQVGDNVIIKDTGRRALITAELPAGHFQVEYLPNPAADPIERDFPPAEDEGGVYTADDLESVTS
jgi:hypothetical protein